MGYSITSVCVATALLEDFIVSKNCISIMSGVILLT